MAEITLNVEKPTVAGLAATYTGSLSTSNNYHVQNNGRVVLHFKKTGAGACTVTLVTPRTIDGLAVADPTANVPATTGDRFVGPFSRETYGDDLVFSLSDVAGLSVAVLSLD